MTVSPNVRADAGFSLVETIVSMMLMAVFGTLFTSAIILMNSSSNKAESLTVVSGQLDQGFEALDRTVRYASAISTPGTGTTGDWYVEYRTNYDGNARCSQLRVDIASSQLQMRTWASGTTPTATDWKPLANGITNGGAPAGSGQPFVLSTPAGAVHQQLTVNLASTSGVSGQSTMSASSVTFTALNSAATPVAGLCPEGNRS